MMDEEFARSLRARRTADEDLRSKCLFANVAQQLFGAFSEVRVAGTEFKVLRRLGAGAMGVVYEVERADRSGTLALKLLHHAGSEEAFRLKREFRTLSRLGHPNLVVLHELFADEHGAAFTMEHVRGCDFLAYVQPEGKLVMARLRAVLVQLLEGLSALHAEGVIHRDLKPSNVLVTDDGRAVLLDFGVALLGLEREVCGTMRFMAPEQASGKSVPASDLFALGVMLELALQRSAAEAPDAPDQREIDTLARLCEQLKHADPAQRPSADALLRQLGGTPRSPLSCLAAHRFVGRSRELSQLFALCAEARTAPRVVHLEALSGHGKSALLAEFARQLTLREQAPLVLRGRCCRRETVRHRALDPLFDALSDELREASPELIAALGAHVTRHVLELVPVLERVAAFARHKSRGALLADARERRVAAVAGLRRLLAHLAAARSLVMCIDDVHWLDEESLELMRELLRGGDAPAVLWVCAGRPSEADDEGLEQQLGIADFHHLRLEPLARDEARLLADELMPGRNDLAARAAAMSAGSPLMLVQLSELALESHSVGEEAALERVVAHRIDSLPPVARHTLEAVALCGEPVTIEVLCSAGDSSRAELECTLNLLEAQRYIRATTTRPPRLEPYHDQIAELVQRSIPRATRRRVHLRIALALEAEFGASSARALSFHYRQAGDSARALACAETAARRAVEQLSFHEAAALFAECAVLEVDAERRAQLLGARADALADAGRDYEAAEVLRSLAERPGTDAQRFKLACSAAELFFRAGHSNEAMELLTPWLRRLRIPPRRTAVAATVSFVHHRLQRRVAQRLGRDLWSSRPPVDPMNVDRVEACLLVARGLARARLHESLDYASRAAIHVARGATDEQLVRALLLESLLQANLFPWRGRGEELVERARALSANSEDPVLRGRVLMGSAQCAAVRCDRPAMHEFAAQAVVQFERHGRGLQMELAEARGMCLLARFGRGEDVAAAVQQLVDDAMQRKDRHIEASGRVVLAHALLANGDVARARHEADAADERVGRQPNEPIHWTSAGALARIELSEGEPERAYQRMRRVLRTTKWSGYQMLPWLRVEMYYLFASAALQRGRDGDRRAARLFADKLSGEKLRWPRLLGRQLSAALLAHEGESARAVVMLRELASELEPYGATWYARGSLLLAQQIEGGGACAKQLSARATRRAAAWRPDVLAAYAPLRCS